MVWTPHGFHEDGRLNHVGTDDSSMGKIKDRRVGAYTREESSWI